MSSNDQRLEEALGDCFDKPFGALPESAQRRILQDWFLFTNSKDPNGAGLAADDWNSLTPEARRDRAAQWDHQHHPDFETERNADWELFARECEIERRIREMDLMQPRTPIEIDSKERQLAAYRKELGDIRKRRVTPEERKSAQSGSNRYGSARDMAREIAQERWENDEKPVPRIGQVAADIERAIGADLSAVRLKAVPLRETIKDWIRDLAPKEALKGGRPPKKPNPVPAN